MMKVLILIGKTIDETSGGSGSAIKAANILCRSGMDVGVVSQFNEESRKLFDKDIKLYETDLGRSYMKDSVLTGVDIYKKEGYDILQSHIPNPTSNKWLDLLVPNNVNTVSTTHLYTLGGRTSLVYGPHGREITFKDNFRIVQVNNCMVDMWRNFCKIDSEIELPNVSVIHDTIDYDDNSGLVPSDGREDRILIVGRICQDKETLESLRYAREYGVPTILIGRAYEASDRNNRKEKVKDLEYIAECEDIINSSENIIWYKSLSNEEVQELMKTSRVLLHMSKYESLSFSILESLYNGLAVVYNARCEGSTETLSQEEITIGYPVFNKNLRFKRRLEAIDEAVNNVDYSKVSPESYRDYFLRNFSKEIYVERYRDLYEGLINREKSTRSDLVA